MTGSEDNSQNQPPGNGSGDENEARTGRRRLILFGAVAAVAVTLLALGFWQLAGPERPAQQAESAGQAEGADAPESGDAAATATAETDAPASTADSGAEAPDALDGDAAAAVEATGTGEDPAALSERVLGDPDAPVTLIEFSSLTCPHCATFHAEVLPRLKENFIEPGTLKLVMRDFPLDGAAAAGAMLARCAPEARYFPLLETLFEKQSSWARSEKVLEELARYGRFAGMSQETINACFENQKLFQAISRKRDEYAEAHDIASTPTFILRADGEQQAKIVGAQPYETFVEKIEAQLD